MSGEKYCKAHLKARNAIDIMLNAALIKPHVTVLSAGDYTHSRSHSNTQSESESESESQESMPTVTVVVGRDSTTDSSSSGSGSGSDSGSASLAKDTYGSGSAYSFSAARDIDTGECDTASSSSDVRMAQTLSGLSETGGEDKTHRGLI